MRYTTIISIDDFRDQFQPGKWIVIDCRFSLQNPEYGYLVYRKSHIPGAIYADLEKDLSGEIIPGKTGRHPLPDIEVLASLFSNWGIDESVQVVAYDDQSGAFAARLWWLLQWLGHESVAVLSGGWQHWLHSGFPVEHKMNSCTPKLFSIQLKSDLILDADQVHQILDNPEWLLIDARSSDRYRGENETIDPIAGHIPSAISIPYAMNLTEENIFKSPDELRKLYTMRIDDRPTDKIVMYCGSGVTAAMNVLGMKHAGLGVCRLYPGSWSEWIVDPNRPME